MLFRKLSQGCLLLCALFFIVSCDNAETRYQKYMDRGNSYYEAGDFERARVEYRNAAKIMPDSAEALYKIGLVEEADGHLKKAATTFIMAEQQNPEFIPVLEKLAGLFFWARQDEQAQKRVDMLLKLDPENANGHAINGSLFLRRKDIKAASKEVEAALRKDPKNPIAFSVLSGTYVAEGRFREALDSLERGVSFNPDNLSLLLLKAAIFNELGDMEGVEKTYYDIIALQPENAEFGYELATLLIKSGKVERAEAVYRKMVEDFPEDLDVKYKLVLLVEQHSGAEPAKKIVESFISSNPEEGVFPLWLADIYVRHNEQDLAIETLNQLIGTDPEEKIELKARNTLAGILFNKGDVEAAENLVNMVLEKNINDNEAIFLRAAIVLSRKDYRQAIADLRMIPDESPTALKAAKLEAEAQLLEGQPNLAIEILDEIMKKKPDDLGVKIRLSQVYEQTGNGKQAQKMLEEITTSSPHYVEGWVNLARIAQENGGQAEVEAVLTAAVEKKPEDETPYILLARLMMEAGRIDDAIGVLAQAEAIMPSAIKAPVLRADAMIKLDRIDEAIAIYENVLMRDSTIDLVANNLAQILADSKSDDDVAMERARTLVQRFINSENPQYLDTLGWVYFRSGDLVKAESVLAKALSLQTEPDADIRSHYGTVLMAAGREDEAKEYLPSDK